MRLFIIILLFYSTLFAQYIIESGEATGTDKTEAQLKARANAKKLAISNIATTVSSSIEISKGIKNGQYSNETITTTKQKSQEKTVKLIEVIDEKISSSHSQGFGTIYKVKIKAKFEVIDIEKSLEPITPTTKAEINKAIEKSNHPLKTNTNTLVKVSPKDKPIKPTPPKNNKNFSCNLRCNIKNKYLKNMKPKLLIISNKEFDKFKNLSSNYITNDSKYFNKIKKYSHQFKNNKINTKLKNGVYKIKLFFEEKGLITFLKNGKYSKFIDLEINNKYINKIIEISDNNF
jgi:hypothetical protein